MNRPLEVFVTDTEIFTFEFVKGDEYQIMRDGKVAYGMISKAQGEKYMRSIRILYGPKPKREFHKRISI